MCRELQNYLQIYTCTITVIHMLLVDISGQTQDYKFGILMSGFSVY